MKCKVWLAARHKRRNMATTIVDSREMSTNIFIVQSVTTCLKIQGCVEIMITLFALTVSLNI